jgi:hypothetical protein
MSGTSGAALSSDEFRVERRANGEASSVMRMELRTAGVVSAAGRLYVIAGGERAWTFRAGIVPMLLWRSSVGDQPVPAELCRRDCLDRLGA